MAEIDIDDLKKVATRVERANGLPNAYYTDEQVFEAEKSVLFANTWACIGFGKDVGEIGDAFPVNFLGQPLLIVRDKDAEILVFKNICRHRGMILVDKPSKLRSTIRCPYHSWTYELNGSLRATPHVGGAGVPTHECIKKNELGLLKVRSHVFMDMVFVNLSGDAPDFEDHTASLRTRWHEFVDRPLYHGGSCSSFQLNVKTNWKLASENYCESYHLPWIHPGLNSYSKIEDHYNIVQPMEFSGQGTTVYSPQSSKGLKRFDDFAGLCDKWDAGAEYIALYPNVLLGVHRDHTFAILLDPKSANQTIERVEIYYASPDMLADDMADARHQNAALWKEVFLEDIEVVEGMQRGRAVTDFDGGRFSPVLDTGTHCLHAWVAERFIQARARSG